MDETKEDDSNNATLVMMDIVTGTEGCECCKDPSQLELTVTTTGGGDYDNHKTPLVTVTPINWSLAFFSATFSTTLRMAPLLQHPCVIAI